MTSRSDRPVGKESGPAAFTTSSTGSSPRCVGNHLGQKALTLACRTEASKMKQFTSQRSLQSHFQKHCVQQRDTPCATAQDYLNLANNTITNATHSKVVKGGKTNYYNSNTGQFVVVGSNDKIITCFKPSSGLNYYNNSN
jgi:hypothetical protein